MNTMSDKVKYPHIYFCQLHQLSYSSDYFIGFYHNAFSLRVIIIPDGCETEVYDWSLPYSNCFILSEPYPVFDIKTLKKFDIPINNNYIDEVCKRRKFDVLAYLIEKNKLNGYEKRAMNYATYIKGSGTELLEWWLKNSTLSTSQLEYTTSVIDYLADSFSEDTCIKKLRWWFDSGLPLKYTNTAMDNASSRGYVKLLQMWKDSGHKLKYSKDSMDSASGNGKTNALQWWVESGLPLKYSESAINSASGYNKINALIWWKNSKLPLKYDEFAMDEASQHCHLHILKWWKNSKLPLKYSENAIDELPTFNPNLIDIKNPKYNDTINAIKATLSWWFKHGLESGLELKYTEKALKNLCKYSLCDVLELWKNSGYPLKYDLNMLYTIRSMSWSIHKILKQNVFNWWKTSGLPINLPN